MESSYSSSELESEEEYSSMSSSEFASFATVPSPSPPPEVGNEGEESSTLPEQNEIASPDYTPYSLGAKFIEQSSSSDSSCSPYESSSSEKPCCKCRSEYIILEPCAYGIFGSGFCPTEINEYTFCTRGFGRFLVYMWFTGVAPCGNWLVCWYTTVLFDICEPCEEEEPPVLSPPKKPQKPNEPIKFKVTTNKLSYKAGETVYVTVKAVRCSGIFKNYNGVANISLNGEGTFPQTVTINNGVGYFTGVFCEPTNERQIFVSNENLFGKSKLLLVTKGDAEKIIIKTVGNIEEIKSCQLFTIEVCLQDNCGNIIRNSEDEIYFSSSDFRASLPLPIKFNPKMGGCTTRTMSLSTIGTQTIYAYSSNNNNLLGSMNIEVKESITRDLRFEVVDGKLYVISLDKCGNRVTTYEGTVIITYTCNLNLPSNVTFTLQDNGRVLIGNINTTNCRITGVDSEDCSINGIFNNI